jgi:nitrate/TMAO reductase-like tetraheme cytochrome c subunit
VKLKTKIIAHPLITAALVLAFVGVAAAAVPAFQATETPQFCRNCHEMGPYYDAWATGAHKGVDCVDCHVDAGAVNHVKHKVVATQELWVHISGDPRFPQGTAEVPNARCLKCHAGIMDKTGPTFSHKQHAGAGPCVECHADAGHQVTTQALAKAGILKAGLEASNTATIVPAAARSDATSGTPAHSPVSCTKCHDLAKVACSKCHKPAHPDRGECATCHRPGARWSFSHPLSEDCASCHAAPAKHFGSVCTSCHSPSVPFTETVYKHVSPDCASCHAAPAKHRAGACAICHQKPGVSWAFSHPASSACGSCHKAPANHFGSSCATCHRLGVPFKSAVYRHTSSACASCHKAPAGHNRAVSCATCHKKPGVSWAATHPTSSACASCHKAPANHFGSSCSSCHKPLVAWRSATFKHPSTGSEHTYRSFACAKCHPSGYSSHTCTACHGANGGGD